MNTVFGLYPSYKSRMIRLGYPTQNLTIPAGTNRTLRLANLQNVEKLKLLVRENIEDLKEILRWNAARGIGLFRIGQSLVPFASHPAFPYDWREEHKEDLFEAGELARADGIRLSMHPGQYIQPSSLRSEVVQRSVEEIRASARILSLLGGSESVLILHLGGKSGGKAATSRRFVDALWDEEEVLRYLALENDERIWALPEVVETASLLSVPAITDTLHHELNPTNLTLRQALDLSLPTWEVRGDRPKLHISSQDPERQAGAHAFSIDPADWDRLLTALKGRGADVMVEAKGKEQALLPMGVRLE